jgi:hypothetical protein
VLVAMLSTIWVFEYLSLTVVALVAMRIECWNRVGMSSFRVNFCT